MQTFSQKGSDPIKFGTDGWRALVAEEFTLPNVRAVTQAVAEYLRCHRAPGRSGCVVVGYDTRPLGDRFAEAVAEVFAGNDLKVLLTDRPTPTPAISFAIRDLHLTGGIAVTASHNPFTYNGLKFKPHYAGPAEPEMTQWIERRLFQSPVRRIPLAEGISRRKIRLVDLAPRYLRFLRGYISWPVLKGADFKVAYDSMHGAGQDLLRQAVAGSRLKILPVADPGGRVLSGYRPEPVGEHLKGLSHFVRRERCDVGLATDGDADRAGVVGPDGRFISSQETMALLLWHLLEDRGLRGMVITTVAGTNLVETIADSYGVPFRRTPVGFKHIARLMRSTEVLFGGEESGGFGFRDCVPERDGLLAGLLVLEMMAMRGKGLPAILEELRTRFGRWIFRRADLALDRPMEPVRILQWAKTLRTGSGTGARHPFQKGAWHLRVPGTVCRIETLDGVKIHWEDGSWLLLRPSGTEPLLRIYCEGRTEREVDRLLEAGRRVSHRLMR